MTKSSERQEQSLTQAKIDPLRQGQRLDVMDQTQAQLDTVMPTLIK